MDAQTCPCTFLRSLTTTHSVCTCTGAVHSPTGWSWTGAAAQTGPPPGSSEPSEAPRSEPPWPPPPASWWRSSNWSNIYSFLQSNIIQLTLKNQPDVSVLLPQCRLHPLEPAHLLVRPSQLLLQTPIEFDGLIQLPITWGADQLQLSHKGVPDVPSPHGPPQAFSSGATALSFNSVGWYQFPLYEGDGSRGLSWNCGADGGRGTEATALLPSECHLQGQAASVAPLQRRAKVLHQLPQSCYLIWRRGRAGRRVRNC